MAYQPFYIPINWENAPAQSTPINQTNLRRAENGIKEADNRIVQLDAKKADQSTLNAMVKDVALDTKTGVLTVTLANGTVKTYDLDIERVVTNFDINDDNELVLTLADGMQKVIDLTRFVYAVDSTATISMTITDRVMRAVLIDGSVTMGKLDAAIQQEFRQYMLDAQAARDTALQYQKYAKRYAIGDEDFPGSEMDCAKYYYEQTKADAATSSQNAQEASESAAVARDQASIAAQKATSATAAANSTAADVLTTTVKAAAAAASEETAKQKAEQAAVSEGVVRDKAWEAADSATLAKRYAVGGVIPEDVKDNAEWYYQQTKSLKEQVDSAAKFIIPHFYIDFTTGKLMSDKEATGMRFWIENGKFYGEVTV